MERTEEDYTRDVDCSAKELCLSCPTVYKTPVIAENSVGHSRFTYTFHLWKGISSPQWTVSLTYHRMSLSVSPGFCPSCICITFVSILLLIFSKTKVLTTVYTAHKFFPESLKCNTTWQSQTGAILTVWLSFLRETCNSQRFSRWPWGAQSTEHTYSEAQPTHVTHMF